MVGRAVHSVIDDGRNRASAAVSAGQVEHRVELIWAGEGWPADVSPILAEAARDWPREWIVVARSFSPGALDLLRAQNANWLDETGRAHLDTASGLIVMRDSPLPAGTGEPSRFRWSRSKVDVAELILAHHEDTFNAVMLTERLGWSHPQVTSILRRFDTAGWTEKLGGRRGVTARRRLAAPAALLDSWAEHVGRAPRERLLAHRVLRDPMAFLYSELAPALTTSTVWAATGWAGLEVSAPFLTAVPTLQVYVTAEAFKDGRLRQAMHASDLHEVDRGARVEFWAASSITLSLSQTTSTIPTVSPPRLYADLRALGGRGEDAAQHVREELLGY